MDYGISLYFTRPELILSLAGLALLVFAAWRSDSGRLISILAVVALFAAGAHVVELLTNPAYEFGGDAFSGTYRMDTFGSFSKLIIYAAAVVSLIIAPRYLEKAGGMRGEYPVLILFAAVGMGIMVSATDLMTLYIGLELNSLASYVLASFLRNDGRSAEAGLKYFVLGALASGILLYGISLIYGFTGTTSFDGIAQTVGGELGLGTIFGIVFMLAGLAFKLSAVPFHMWTPDVYEGAPTPVTAFFATAPKVAAMALTTRIVISAFGPATDSWQPIIIFLALASIILGAVGAIGQKNIKRLLAYSSINNIGYMLVGLAAGTQAGVQAVLTYLLVYIVTTLGAFLFIMQLRDENGNMIENISDYAGLSQRRLGLAAAMAVFLFSLAGIPPLFGFWPKYLVFEAAVNADLIPLAVAGIVASVIGAFYYIAIIKTMFFDDASDIKLGEQGPRIERILLLVSALWLSVVGYLFIPALDSVSTAAAAVLF